MKMIAFVPLLVSALLAVLLIVGFLREAEPITAVNPVFCPTTEPVATPTPDGGPTYTPTVTHTPCFIKLTSTPTVTPTPTPTPGGPAMSLRVDASQTIKCDGGDVPGEVCVPIDAKFDVIVVADAIPISGYFLTQAWVDYGNTGLVHKKNTYTVWPDAYQGKCLDAQDVDNYGAFAGCLNAPILPYPASFHVGDLFSFSLTCAVAGSHALNIVPSGQPPAGINGALFTETTTYQDFVPAVSGMQVTCIPNQDTDGDGCSDARENGTDETLGGLRNYLDPNDYFDVLGPGQSLTLDGVIDLPNDILGVIQHFSPQGQPPYDVRFDRGVTIGANHWERDAPDGVIDLPNDILGVIQQFGHNCV